MSIFDRLFRRGLTSGAKDEAYTDTRLGIAFPMELGGLRRLATGRTYGEGDRAGESIPYGAEDVQATIYVTTVDKAQFPDGGDSEFVAGEIESALAAVKEMERMGRYQSVKFFPTEPEGLGTNPANPTWARGAFFAVNNGCPMMSFTYITALRCKIIKLRISAPKPDNRKLVEFPHALGDLIGRHGLGDAQSS